MKNIFLNDFLEVHEDEEFYIIKNRITNRYFKLRPRIYWNIKDSLAKESFSMEHNKKYEYLISEILSKEVHKKNKKFNFLNFNVPLADNKINNLLTNVKKDDIKFFFNKKFMMLNVFVFVLIVILIHEHIVTHLKLYPITIIWLFTNTIVHEISHALACYCYNRMPFGFGIKFLCFIPTFYVNTTDILMSGKVSRYIVSFAGVHANLFLGNCMYFVYSFFPDNYFLQMSFISYLIGLFNLLPFYKLDGYYLLSDFFNVYDLYTHGKLTIKKIRKHKLKINVIDIFYVAYYIFCKIMILIASCIGVLMLLNAITDIAKEVI